MRHVVLLYPVFVQVLLTFFLLVAMGRARVAAIKRREVKVRDIALGQSAWPDRPAQIARAYQNQLEMPVLFFAVVAFTMITNQVSTPMVVLAWLFVALRLGHAFIHVTGNNVTRRFAVFIAGVLVLAAMWLLLAVRIVTA